MIKVETYPHSFKLSGELWELNKNMIRWIRVNGEENKMSLTGDVVGVAVFNELDDAVVVIEYPHNKVFHTMGKQSGWKGPFKGLSSVVLKDGKPTVTDSTGDHTL